MSHNASTWASRQWLGGDSSAKNVLKEFAHWAAEDYTSWITMPEFHRSTELNEKTIGAAVKRLVVLGYLRDTGRRRGETRQIVIYQITAPAGSVEVKAEDPRTGKVETLSPPNLKQYEDFQKRNASEIGGVKDIQKRKGSKTGSLPNLDSKTSKNGVKDLQKRIQSPPKQGDEVSLRVLEGEREKSEGGTASPSLTIESINPVPPGFTRMWSAYPSETGRRTRIEACLAKWLELDLEPHAELIVMHLEAMKRVKDWRDGFMPTALKYLTERMWRDGKPETAKAVLQEAVDQDWWLTNEGVEQEAKRIGVAPIKDEPPPKLLVRVAFASGYGPWIAHALDTAKRISPTWFQEVVRGFGDALIPSDYFTS